MCLTFIIGRSYQCPFYLLNKSINMTILLYWSEILLPDCIAQTRGKIRKRYISLAKELY